MPHIPHITTPKHINPLAFLLAYVASHKLFLSSEMLFPSLCLINCSSIRCQLNCLLWGRRAFFVLS